jgi:hypothetical protein
MPLKRHYKGEGDKVARSMKQRYGKDWERVFYATENKQKRKAKQKRSKKR